MKYKFTALKTGLLISLLMGCACCNLRRNTVEQIQIIPADTVKSLFSNHESNDTPVEKKMRDQGLVDIAEQDSSIAVRLVYATPYNFMGKRLYHGLTKAFMLPETAGMLIDAKNRLKAIRPDLNHAIKRDPRTGMRSANNNWDFWTLLPEALHQVTITMSPRGIPASFRHMHGFGSHTFSFYDKDNKRTWVKFHFRTLQGIKNLTDAEAEAVIAKDRESNQRDLFEAIERGDYPRWLMQVQLMTEEEARNYKINPFDLTKVWYHGDFPLHDVGILELNRNPDNFFAEIEQAAFNPANVIEGIGFSPDKMLQGRLFSYGDAQRYRLGVNNNLIPVNKPRCPFHDYHRDGQMRTDGNYGATIPYQPNSYGEWQDSPNLKEPPLEVNGAIYNYDERELDSDYFTQPGKLWRLMSAEDQRATCENTARAMGDSALFIKQRHVRNCSYADPEYGKGVAKALGIDYEEALKAEDPAHPTWDPRNKK